MMVIQNSCFFIMFFYIFSISTNFIVRGRNLQLVHATCKTLLDSFKDRRNKHKVVWSMIKKGGTKGKMIIRGCNYWQL